MKASTLSSGLRIVFLGTPAFAVASLKALHESHHEIVGVVTAPDRPAGRGRKPRPSAVKEFAEAHQLPLFQPEKLRDEQFQSSLRALKADLFVVVAFRMMPKELWSMPPMGTFNLHASLLPDYRGAAPINWSIWNGDRETGLTTFFINEVIDSGEWLMQRHCLITPEDNAGSLHDKLMNLGASLVVETANGLENGTLQPQAQDLSRPMRPAPKIFTEDTWLDPQGSAKQLHQQVRALSPYPGAKIRLSNADGKQVEWKILQTRVIKSVFQHKRKVLLMEKRLIIPCAEGGLEIISLQPEGKKPMLSKDFLNGFKQQPDFEILSN